MLAGELRCDGCDRAPLVGEWATLYARGGEEAWLCELCDESAVPGRLGEALRRQRVRSAGASNVRRVA